MTLQRAFLALTLCAALTAGFASPAAAAERRP